MKKFYIIFLLIYNNHIVCQDTCKYTILFKNLYDDTLREFEYEHLYKKITTNIPYTIRFKKYTLEVNLLDCKGSAIIKMYNKITKKIIKEMRFICGLGLLKRYVFIEDAFNTKPKAPKELIYIEDYYQALPDGDWIYYDDEANIKRVEKYSYGELMNNPTDIRSK